MLSATLRRNMSTAKRFQRHVTKKVKGHIKDSEAKKSEEAAKAADISIGKHFGKTLITYGTPMALFGLYSYYNTKQEEKKGPSPFGQVVKRFLSGENVLEGMRPRKEYIKVTRLNAKFDNYRYCVEKNLASGKARAELQIKHSETLSKLNDRVRAACSHGLPAAILSLGLSL